MELIGLFAAAIMGATLGLVGGGGSILTVPILVYLVQVKPVEATAYSLFIVGISSFVGSMAYIKQRQVNFKVAAVFALPAFVGVYLVRRFGMPMLPETLDLGVFEVTKDSLVLIVFSIVMLMASYSMIRGRADESVSNEKKKLNFFLVGAEGLIVGAITGFVGAGGGFLIIPALVVLAGLEMKIAVGTSLLIITIKSLFGFVGDLQTAESINWSLLMQFSIASILGIFFGVYLSRKIPGKKLKPAFGWFVLVMGLVIFVQQVR